MIKIAKTISTSAIAIATALVMAVSASAACAHGKYGTRTGEPKYGGTYTHMHNGVQCTVTNYVAVTLHTAATAVRPSIKQQALLASIIRITDNL